MPAGGAHTKLQQPIFRRNPELEPVTVLLRRAPCPPERIEIVALPLVTPLGVFVARRKSFDCIVRAPVDKRNALTILFRELPLDENGWDESETKLELLGPSRDGWPIWRISRGQ